MHDWLKQNQKKLMAIFGAMLMVTFLINRSPDDYRNRRNENGAPLGKAGKFILYTNQVRRLREEWRILLNCYDVNSYRRAPELLGPSLAGDISGNETLFPLLVHEAETCGIQISDDVVGSAAQNQYRHFGRDEQLPPESPILHGALRHFLMVKALRDLVGNDVKLSDPAWRHRLADLQKVSLNVVDFKVDSLKTFAPLPTTQQVQAQFDHYKNVLPNDPARPADDVLGFGYKVPDRVKVQFVTIARAAVMAAVKAGHADPAGKGAFDYDLQLKAAEYYYNHQSDYTIAPPATQPTTGPATTAPTTQPAVASSATQPAASPALAKSGTTQPVAAPAVAASTQPTTRPFAQVKDQIVDKLLEPEADELQKKIVDAVRQELALAAKTMPTTGPSTHPTTGPAVAQATAPAPTTLPSTLTDAASAVDAAAGLGAIALDIQLKFHVLPEVTQLPSWLDESALEHIGSISDAHTDAGVAFPQYVFQNAAAFAIAAPGPESLQLWQPTVVLKDDKNSAYIARLTGASPAHAPVLADVQAKAEEDVRIKWAYDKAQDKAKQMLEAANRSTLSRAALDDHRAITSTGEFPLIAGKDSEFIPNFQASPDTTAAMRDQAKTLLTKAATGSPHPRAILPLPADRRVVVVELGEVVLPIPESRLSLYRSFFAQQDETRQVESLTAAYFSLEAVSARLGYKSDKSGA